MGEQPQLPPINEKELETVQKYFKGNEELLKSMRAVMLNISPSESDIKVVTDIFKENDELYTLVYKRFLPALSKDAPIGQVSDVWLGAEQMIFGQPESAVIQAVEYKELSIIMTRQALESLRTGVSTVDVDFSPRKYLSDPLAINLLARNQFVRHIESQLLFLKLIAEQVKASPANKAKNSAK